MTPLLTQQGGGFTVLSAVVMTVKFFFSFSFLKQCYLKLVCMLKQKNTKFTMQEDTLKALYYCNIVDV